MTTRAIACTPVHAPQQWRWLYACPVLVLSAMCYTDTETCRNAPEVNQHQHPDIAMGHYCPHQICRFGTDINSGHRIIAHELLMLEGRCPGCIARKCNGQSQGSVTSCCAKCFEPKTISAAAASSNASYEEMEKYA